jgi:aspartyl-tRNA(Asn)/glutamyl-tRNA(Gln) amidotransferase subunit A
LQNGYKWTALDLLRAYGTLRSVTEAFARAFTEVDCLVGAVLPVTATRIGEMNVTINGREATVVDAFTRLNAAQNIAGVPSLCVPCGTANGLPVGFQVMSATNRDDVALRLAAAFERSR